VNLYELLLGGGVFALFFRAQLLAFLRGFLISVRNSTKVGEYYIMRNRSTDNVFLVQVVAEKLFSHPGCHVKHLATGWVENIAWGIYDGYTFMRMTKDQLAMVHSGKSILIENNKMVFDERHIKEGGHDEEN